MSDKPNLSDPDLAEMERQLYREWWFTEYYDLVARRQRERQEAKADRESDEDAA